MTTWTKADKARAFEWLRSLALEPGAPEEADIALFAWQESASAAPAPRLTPNEDAVDRVAKAIADVVGHGMREKCERMAQAAIAAMPPTPGPLRERVQTTDFRGERT